MSSELPALPNEAPADIPEDAASKQTQEDNPVTKSGESEETSEAPKAPPKALNVKPPPPPPSPAAPEMPAMPSAPEGEYDEDDDDFEIPDEDEFERMLDQQDHAPAGSDGDDDALPEGVLEGVVVTLRHDGAFVDVGEKSEAFLPITAPKNAPRPEWKTGDVIEVTAVGRSPEGYLLLSNSKAERPTDWSHLESAYAAGSIVVGKVIEVVKGGLAVDVGARAFLPASRSGEREQEALEALVGQEIRARIAQLDLQDRNVVLDRRTVVEEERNQARQEAVAGLKPGAVLNGIVRTIRDFGAFVDLGGVDALLHISDLSWKRVENVRSVVKEGDELQVQVLRIDPEGRRIAVGLKQLQQDPWTTVAEKVKVGERITGKITRLMDFGAFVELTPGAEGLIHISEMSWARRVRHPSDVVSEGEEVEVVVLDMDLAKRRVALGLKQALGDPWDKVETDFPVGSVFEGTVRKITNFGAFVEVTEGVEGLLHISDITSDRRLNHPNEVVRTGDNVRVKVLEMNRAKRRLKLGMKQLEPTETEKYLETVQPGDLVSGRVLTVGADRLEVQLDDGVKGVCALPQGGDQAADAADGESTGEGVSSLAEKLKAGWQGGGGEAGGPAEGELRSFRVSNVDAVKGVIELELA